MVDVAEHVYDDDPSRGHPDVCTRLPGVSYFFLGNGLIQAAVQHAAGGEGTPLGVLVMDPDCLGRKRDSLTMDPERGLDPTMIRVSRPGGVLEPRPAMLVVSWKRDAGIPTVLASWGGDGLVVHERFCCPSATRPRLARSVEVHNYSDTPQACRLGVGAGSGRIEREILLAPDARARLVLAYDLDTSLRSVSLQEIEDGDVEASAAAAWSDRAAVTFHDPVIDHAFGASLRQLPTAISARGCMDGGIWQYNREWVRDQAFVAQALTMLGHRERATAMLRRLLTGFVTPEGATLDSSEARSRDDVELDQNGVLLYVLGEYVNWTGCLELVTQSWERVTALAEYPLRPEFRHSPSGLLSGSREFWERHAAHGIEPGLEMIYQVFVSIGLGAAARLALKLGRTREAERWQSAADGLRSAVLSHPTYALHDARGFLKRRTLDGRVQESVVARPDAGLPAGVPLASDRRHLLNPDTCAVLPVVFGFVEPDSAVARATLRSVERLWNQEWSDGGYGRYDVSSEPDSPGAWPFASIFVARACVEAGHSAPVWRVLRWLSQAPGAASGSWFEFNGPRLAPPFPQVGVIPWTWAEMTILVIRHLLGVRPGADAIRVRPRLLDGLDRVEARLPVRDGWLRLDLRCDRAAPADREFVVPYGPGEMVVSGTVRPVS